MAREYGSESRWVYLDDLLKFVIKDNRCDKLLMSMFGRDKFVNLMLLGNSEEINEAYLYCTGRVILFWGRHEMKNVQGHFKW